MCKKPLKDRQMSDATYLDEAEKWSKELTRMRSSGPGGVEKAMYEVESIYGIDYWLQWRLRYRRADIKSISVSAYMRLKAGHQSERERQMRMLQNENRKLEEVAGPNNAVVVAVKGLVGEGEK
jgi:hypothetical protein